MIKEFYTNIIAIQENKDGSDQITFDLSKDIEELIMKYYKRKKFTREIFQKFIMESLENYIKRNLNETQKTN